MTAVALEVGKKRVFASAVEWPGWCRSGPDEAGALDTLVTYAPRYKAAVRDVAAEYVPPERMADVQVVERLLGGAGTDFGAPGAMPTADTRPLGEVEGRRQLALLQACWVAFDRAVATAQGRELRLGPRGGGRSVLRMIEHALEADRAYLTNLGGRAENRLDPDPASQLAGVHEEMVRTWEARLRGEVPFVSPRRTRPLWFPRFFVRYAAWHALDHAWEIEDRMLPA